MEIGPNFFLSPARSLPAEDLQFKCPRPECPPPSLGYVPYLTEVLLNMLQKHYIIIFLQSHLIERGFGLRNFGEVRLRLFSKVVKETEHWTTKI